MSHQAKFTFIRICKSVQRSPKSQSETLFLTIRMDTREKTAGAQQIDLFVVDKTNKIKWGLMNAHSARNHVITDKKKVRLCTLNKKEREDERSSDSRVGARKIKGISPGAGHEAKTTDDKWRRWWYKRPSRMNRRVAEVAGDLRFVLTLNKTYIESINSIVLNVDRRWSKKWNATWRSRLIERSRMKASKMDWGQHGTAATSIMFVRILTMRNWLAIGRQNWSGNRTNTNVWRHLKWNDGRANELKFNCKYSKSDFKRMYSFRIFSQVNASNSI